MLSILCAYNDEEILKNVLEYSLQLQENANYEFIPINAENHNFSSAAETLNYVAKKAKGEYLLFIHQDVLLEDKCFLEKVENWCERSSFGIAGVAGCINKDGKSVTVSNIYHGKDHKKVCTDKIDMPIPVESLDECLLIIPQNIFGKFTFSDLGRTWHLYGTDYCLKMKLNGYSSVVLPLSVWHFSNGASLNVNYFESINKLALMYKKNVKKITTIFGVWPTNTILLYIKCTFRKMRLLIKGK